MRKMACDWRQRWEQDQIRRRGTILPRCYHLFDQAKFLENVLNEPSQPIDMKLVEVALDELIAQIDDELSEIDELQCERRREARLSVLKFNQFVESQLTAPHLANSFTQAHSCRDDQYLQQQIDDFYNAFLQTNYGRTVTPLWTADTFAEYLSNGFRTVHRVLRNRQRSGYREQTALLSGGPALDILPSYLEANKRSMSPKFDSENYNGETSIPRPFDGSEGRTHCTSLQLTNHRSDSQQPPKYHSSELSLASSQCRADHLRNSDDSLASELFFCPAVPMNTSPRYFDTHSATDKRPEYTSRSIHDSGERKSSSTAATSFITSSGSVGDQACVTALESLSRLASDRLCDTRLSQNESLCSETRCSSLALPLSTKHGTEYSTTSNSSKESFGNHADLTEEPDRHPCDLHCSEKDCTSENGCFGSIQSGHISSKCSLQLETNDALSSITLSTFPGAGSISVRFKSDSEAGDSQSVASSNSNRSDSPSHDLRFSESKSYSDKNREEDSAVLQDSFSADQKSATHSSCFIEDESKRWPIKSDDLCNLLKSIAEVPNAVDEAPKRFECIVKGRNSNIQRVVDRYGLRSPPGEIGPWSRVEGFDAALSICRRRPEYEKSITDIESISVSSANSSTIPSCTGSISTSPCIDLQAESSNSPSTASPGLFMRGGAFVARARPPLYIPFKIPFMLARRIVGRIEPLMQDEGALSTACTWILWFINSRGNEYFCDVDEEYLTDRFNLTGLNTEVQYYQYALDLITDVFDLDCDDEVREQIEKSARHLYGLVHSRYIATNRGLQKMMEKYKNGDFGKCPRVACQGQYLLPTGQSDVPNASPVKLYCARCEDLYNPKSPRHSAIDGAYFGTSFPHILFQVYPQALPEKSQKRYEPRIYGFRVHSAATLARWQTEKKEEMKLRLTEQGLETGFEEEEMEEEMEFEDEDEIAQDGIDDMFEGRRASAGALRR